MCESLSQRFVAQSLPAQREGWCRCGPTPKLRSPVPWSHSPRTRLLLSFLPLSHSRLRRPGGEKQTDNIIRTLSSWTRTKHRGRQTYYTDRQTDRQTGRQAIDRIYNYHIHVYTKCTYFPTAWQSTHRSTSHSPVMTALFNLFAFELAMHTRPVYTHRQTDTLEYQITSFSVKMLLDLHQAITAETL